MIHPLIIQAFLELVSSTESMDELERLFWRNLAPSMTELQLLRVSEILQDEKERLKAIEEKYFNESEELHMLHLMQWQEFNEALENNRNPNFIHHGPVK